MDASLPSIDNTVDGTIPSAAILAGMENATFIMPTDDGMQGQDMQQTTMYTMEQVSLPHDGLVDHRTAEFHSNVFLIANPTNAEGFDGTQYLSTDQQCLYVVDPSMTQVGNIGIVEGATFNLVEMAPMAMGNSTDQTYRYDTGTGLPTDDVISDAQAAELLMKVSESRNHDIPYVHVQLAHNSEGYTQLVEVPMESGGGLLGSGYQPMVCVQSVAQGNWATQSVMDTTATTAKYSDIVSASMEAISFPDNATTTMNLTPVSQDFADFDENTVTYEEQIKSLPRPVRSRESIEARINRLLRGQNADDTSKLDKPADKPTTNSISTLSKPASPKVVSTTVKPSVGKLLKSKLAETCPATPVAKKKIIMHMDGIDLPLEVNMTDNTKINLPLNPPPVPMNTGSNVDDVEVIYRNSKARTRETAGKYAVKVGMRTIQTSSVLIKQRRPFESKTEQVANMAFSDDMETAGEIEIEYSYSATTPKNAPPPQVKVIVPVKTPLPSTPTINPQPETVVKPSIPYTPRARGANKRVVGNSATSTDPSAPTSIDLHDSVPEDELNVKLPWMKPVEEEPEPPKPRTLLPRTRRVVMSSTAPVVKVYGAAQPNLSRIQPKPISTSISSLADDEEELDHDKASPVSESVIANTVVETAESRGKEVNEVKTEFQAEVVVTEEEQTAKETVPSVVAAEVKERTPSPVWTSPYKPDDDHESGLRSRVVRTYTRQRPPKKRKRSALFLVSDDEEEEEEEDAGEDEIRRTEDRTAAEREESKQNNGAVAEVQEVFEPGEGDDFHLENGSKEISSKEKESSGSETAPPEESCCEMRDESTGIGVDGSAKQSIDDIANKENPRSDEKGEVVDDKREENDKREKKRKRSSSVSSSGKKRHNNSRTKKSKSRHSTSDKVPGISSKPCPKCHERFTTTTGFVKHVAQHGVTERRLTCLLCKWQSKGNSKALEAHILEKHKSKLPS